MHHTLSDGLTTPLWKGRAIDLNLHLRKLETNSCLVWSKNWPCGFPTTQAIFFTGRGQIFILRGGSWLRWSVKIWQPNIVGGNWLIWRLLTWLQNFAGLLASFSAELCQAHLFPWGYLSPQKAFNLELLRRLLNARTLLNPSNYSTNGKHLQVFTKSHVIWYGIDFFTVFQKKPTRVKTAAVRAMAAVINGVWEIPIGAGAEFMFSRMPKESGSRKDERSWLHLIPHLVISKT